MIEVSNQIIIEDDVTHPTKCLDFSKLLINAAYNTTSNTSKNELSILSLCRFDGTLKVANEYGHTLFRQQYNHLNATITAFTAESFYDGTIVAVICDDKSQIFIHLIRQLSLQNGNTLKRSQTSDDIKEFIRVVLPPVSSSSSTGDNSPKVYITSVVMNVRSKRKCFIYAGDNLGRVIKLNCEGTILSILSLKNPTTTTDTISSHFSSIHTITTTHIDNNVSTINNMPSSSSSSRSRQQQKVSQSMVDSSDSTNCHSSTNDRSCYNPMNYNNDNYMLYERGDLIVLTRKYIYIAYQQQLYQINLFKFILMPFSCHFTSDIIQINMDESKNGILYVILVNDNIYAVYLDFYHQDLSTCISSTTSRSVPIDSADLKQSKLVKDQSTTCHTTLMYSKDVYQTTIDHLHHQLLNVQSNGSMGNDITQYIHKLNVDLMSGDQIDIMMKFIPWTIRSIQPYIFIPHGCILHIYNSTYIQIDKTYKELSWNYISSYIHMDCIRNTLSSYHTSSSSSSLGSACNSNSNSNSNSNNHTTTNHILQYKPISIFPRLHVYSKTAMQPMSAIESLYSAISHMIIGPSYNLSTYPSIHSYILLSYIHTTRYYYEDINGEVSSSSNDKSVNCSVENNSEECSTNRYDTITYSLSDTLYIISPYRQYSKTDKTSSSVNNTYTYRNTDNYSILYHLNPQYQMINPILLTNLSNKSNEIYTRIIRLIGLISIAIVIIYWKQIKVLMGIYPPVMMCLPCSDDAIKMQKNRKGKKKDRSITTSAIINNDGNNVLINRLGGTYISRVPVAYRRKKMIK